MDHLLLLYLILTFAFGFSILGITVYKYLVTKNKMIGSFLFLWSAMTLTATSYITNVYTYLYVDMITLEIINKLQYFSVCLTGIAPLLFVYKIFNIKDIILPRIALIIGIILTIFLITPVSSNFNSLYYASIVVYNMTLNTIFFVISFKKILLIKEKKNKNLGLFFIFSFLILFILLIIVDMVPSGIKSAIPIPFYPVFYIFVGIFLCYIGLTKTNFKNIKSIENFIKIYSLTKREAEIALLLAEGLTYKAIAEKLSISSGTVSTHVMHIYDKTKTSSKIQLNRLIFSFG